MATAGAVGGAFAGEMLGGDLAAAHIGSVAEPLGQAIGRNLGRIAGGAFGAASVRCQSRPASRKRLSSQVRFALGIQYQADSQLSRRQFKETRVVITQGTEAPTTIAASSNPALASNEDILKATQASAQNMANMFGMA